LTKHHAIVAENGENFFMKLNLVLGIILYLLSGFSLANDQGPFTGIDLMHVCNDAVKFYDNNGNNLTPEQSMHAVMCSSFVSGVFQANLANLGVVFGVRSPKEIPVKGIRQKMYCLPDGINEPSLEQIIRVVLKYLKDNPKDLSVRAGILVYAALLKAFPCT
jgi:hypothetical protein